MILPAPFHVDGFAGGGGASEGWETATGIPVAVALNHNREALAMHRMNHPMTKHYCEDIRKICPVKVCGGRQPTSLWTSPDCKDFSKAKQGQPKSKRIRGLAWTVIHWVNKVRPLVIYLENVEEFAEWCPLLSDGRRNPKLLGWFFKCFVGALRRRGYTVEWKEIRACESSESPTIRKRLYLVARCDGRAIVWPDKTHAPAESAAVKAGRALPQRTAGDCIDFSLPCPSIFLTKCQARKIGCKRPLARASLKRFAKGVERYVMNAAEPFLVNLTHQGNEGVESLREPFKTITSANRGEKAVVSPFFAVQTTGHSGSECRAPLSTILTGGHHTLVSSLLAGVGGRAAQSRPRDGSEPMATITAKADCALVSVYLCQNNRGAIGHDLREPVSTVTSVGSNQSVVACGMVKYYGVDGNPGMRDPLHSVTTRDRFGLFNAQVIPVMTPEIEVTARRVAKFLRRHGVKFEGEFAMCGDLVIYDIGMRMLTPRELYRAQGFGDDYIIDRGMDEDETTGRLFEIKLTKTAQVRMVGNSVCPPMACALIRANQPEYALQEIAA